MRGLPAPSTHKRLKFTLPGPMTIVDTLCGRALRRPRQDGHGLRGRAQRRRRASSPPIGVDVIQFDEPAFNVYLDEVKLGHRGAAARDRRASPARPRCTSATATASRPTSTGRSRWATGGGSTSRLFRRSPAHPIDQVSLECRNSRVPIDLVALLEGKDVLLGSIDVATDARRNTRGSRRRDPRGAASMSRATGFIPAPIAAWRRFAAISPQAKLAALGAGAALVRQRFA